MFFDTYTVTKKPINKRVCQYLNENYANWVAQFYSFWKNVLEMWLYSNGNLYQSIALEELYNFAFRFVAIG